MNTNFEYRSIVALNAINVCIIIGVIGAVQIILAVFLAGTIERVCGVVP